MLDIFYLTTAREREREIKQTEPDKTRQNQTKPTMSNDKNACTNSHGTRGKVISKRGEVWESVNLTEEQVGKIPAQLLHCKRNGLLPAKKPVIIDVDYNLSSGIKKVTYEKEKHLFNNSGEKGKMKEYKETSITREQYPETITEHEKKSLTKRNLVAGIDKEVDNLNLENFTSKGDILKFANGPGYISNTEKKRRAVALMKKVNQFLQDNHKKELAEWNVNKKVNKKINKSGSGEAIPKLERIRVTSLEIASL